MQFRHFRARTVIYSQGDDCLTLLAKTSTASLGVIAALEWRPIRYLRFAQNARCPPWAVTGDSMITTLNPAESA